MLIAKRLTEPPPSVRTARPSGAGERGPGDPEGARAGAGGPVRHGGATSRRRCSAPHRRGPATPHVARRRRPVAADARGSRRTARPSAGPTPHPGRRRRARARPPDRPGRAVRLAARPSGDAAGGRRAPGRRAPVREPGRLGRRLLRRRHHRRGARQAHRAPRPQVTARSSSAQYRQTTKPPQQIGRELGVDYLLMGTVRWEKRPDGTSRVQVSPELIEVAPGGRTKWQQPFDAALTDVFQVQADIAGRVAQALDVALGEAASSRRWRSGRPRTWRPTTRSSRARRRAALGRQPASPCARRSDYLRAGGGAGLGASCAAWAQLVARAASLLYSQRRPVARAGGAARSAAERARRARTRSARGVSGAGRLLPAASRRTSARALEQYTNGLKLAPDNADLLRGLGIAEQALGDGNRRCEHLRRSRALDPRSANAAGSSALLLSGCGGTLRPMRALGSGARARARDRLSASEDRRWSTWPRATSPARGPCWPAAPGRRSRRSSWRTSRTTGTSTGCSTPSSSALLKRLTPERVRRRRGDLGHRAGRGCTHLRATGAGGRATPTRPGRRFEQQLKATPEDPQRQRVARGRAGLPGRKARRSGPASAASRWCRSVEDA